MGFVNHISYPPLKHYYLTCLKRIGKTTNPLRDLKRELSHLTNIIELFLPWEENLRK